MIVTRNDEWIAAVVVVVRAAAVARTILGDRDDLPINERNRGFLLVWRSQSRCPNSEFKMFTTTFLVAGKKGRLRVVVLIIMMIMMIIISGLV